MRKKIKVDFFMQTSEVWPSLESVWEAFKNDHHQCDMNIIRVPFYHINKSLEDSSKRYLEENKIDHIEWTDYDIDKRRPDVVIVQNPYEETRPEIFQTESLDTRGIRIAYVPYCLEIFAGETTNYHFNLTMQKKSWRLFARSENHKRMFQKYGQFDTSHKVKVLGHPKFDSLLNYEPSPEDKKLLKRNQGQKVILWNPHFSVNADAGFSTFLKYKDFLPELFKQRNDIFLLVRPHPLLFNSLEQYGLMSRQEVDTWKNQILASDNMALDETGDYRASFYVSDGMISDASSLALEYLYTKKPILFTFDKGKSLLNEDGYITDYFYQAKTQEDVKYFVNAVALSEDPMLEKRLDIMQDFIYGVDGLAGTRIKEEIVSSILSEKAGIRAFLMNIKTCFKRMTQTGRKMAGAIRIEGHNSGPNT